MPHVCRQCGKVFKTDRRGCRESDWIICDTFCDMRCNLAACDEAEGRSITMVVLEVGDVDSAARRIRSVFDMAEFQAAMKMLAEREALRLGHNAGIHRAAEGRPVE